VFAMATHALSSFSGVLKMFQTYVPSISAISNIRWLGHRGVHRGSSCGAPEAGRRIHDAHPQLRQVTGTHVANPRAGVGARRSSEAKRAQWYGGKQHGVHTVGRAKTSSMGSASYARGTVRR
jgi:hypothetical protein